MKASVIDRRLVFSDLNILHKELIDVNQYINKCANLEILNQAKKLTTTSIAIVFPMFIIIVDTKEKIITPYLILDFQRYFNYSTFEHIHYTDFFKNMSINQSAYNRRLQAYNRNIICYKTIK